MVVCFYEVIFKHCCNNNYSFEIKLSWMTNNFLTILIINYFRLHQTLGILFEYEWVSSKWFQIKIWMKKHIFSYFFKIKRHFNDNLYSQEFSVFFKECTKKICILFYLNCQLGLKKCYFKCQIDKGCCLNFSHRTKKMLVFFYFDWHYRPLHFNPKWQPA